MKTALELKDLAPYLPYGLKIRNIGANTTRTLIHELPTESAIQRNISVQMLLLTNHVNKPILRPLTDLTEDGLLSSINRQKFNTHFNSTGIYLTRYNETAVSLSEFRKIEYYLYENHFDVFGLIDKGLAIDINILSK